MSITTLGKYELFEKLGEGGFGTVYRARDSSLDVIRAVKILHPALIAAPEFIERFRREGRVTAKLDHPHIVPIYELGEDQGHYFLAMKYLSGGSLKDWLAGQGELPFPQAIEIIRQVAAALDYALDQPEKLIHRDLKPGNILFERLPDNPKGVSVRLSDFGFAKALDGADSSSFSTSGGMKGTPAYIAPEIWDDQLASPASDQYALACVFYEMLTGQILFSGATPMALMKHIASGPQLPATWPIGVPAETSKVLRRALNAQPEERYPSVLNFSADVVALALVMQKTELERKTQAEAVDHAAIELREKSEREVSEQVAREKAHWEDAKKAEQGRAMLEDREKVRKADVESALLTQQVNKWPEQKQKGIPVWAWSVVVIFVLCLGVGVIGGFSWLIGGQIATSVPGKLPVATNIIESVLPPSAVATEFIDLVTTSPPTQVIEKKPAGHIVFHSDRNCVSRPFCENIYMMNEDGSNVRNLTENSPSQFNYVSALSPDGTKILYVGVSSGRDSASFYLLNLLNLNLTKTMDIPGYAGGVQQISWSPTGNEIVYDNYIDDGVRSVIELLNIDSSGSTRLTKNNPDDTNPDWSRDGKNIIFFANNVDLPGLYMMDRKGENRVLISSELTGCRKFILSPTEMTIAMNCHKDSSSTGHDIFLLNLETNNFLQITKYQSDEIDPSWSPDGEWLAFASTMDETDTSCEPYAISDNPCNFEIYKMRKNGTGLVRLTFNDAQDKYPDWGK